MIQMETLWQFKLKEMQNYATVIVYGFSLCVSHCNNSSKKQKQKTTRIIKEMQFRLWFCKR